jgi:hypothetical protein
MRLNAKLRLCLNYIISFVKYQVNYLIGKPKYIKLSRINTAKENLYNSQLQKDSQTAEITQLNILLYGIQVCKNTD